MEARDQSPILMPQRELPWEWDVSKIQRIFSPFGILGEMGAFDDDDDTVSTTYSSPRNKYSSRGNKLQSPSKNKQNLTYAAPARSSAKFSSTTGKYTFCRVSRLDNGSCRYYLTDDNSIRVGDTVLVPTDQGSVKGTVISVEHYDSYNSPIPIEKAPKIVGKGTS